MFAHDILAEHARAEAAEQKFAEIKAAADDVNCDRDMAADDALSAHEDAANWQRRAAD